MIVTFGPNGEETKHFFDARPRVTGPMVLSWDSSRPHSAKGQSRQIS